MSTPKSPTKSHRLVRKRRRKQEARLRRKRKKGSLRIEGPHCGFDAPGDVRMSEVMPRFVQPFEQYADGEDAYRRLLTLGMVAWNAALAPESQREEMVDKLLREAVHKVGPGEQVNDQEIASQVIEHLIERKTKHFAHYQRPIFDFMLEDTGDGYHLTVISAIT